MSDDKRPEIGDRICGPFVVFCYPGGQTMFAGTLDKQPLPENSQEIWVCELEVVDVRRFKFPERFRSRRIDQILTDTIQPGELEPIE